MKILFEIIDLSIAGAQKMVVDLSIYLKNKGYDVAILVLSPCPYNNFSKRLDSNYVKTYYVKECGNRILRSIKRYALIETVMKDFLPDVIHNNLDYLYMWTYALYHKRRFVVTIHSQPCRIRKYLTLILYRNLLKKGLVDVVNLTDSLSVEFDSCFYPTKSYIIPNPFNVSSDQRKKRRPDSTIRFLSIARFHPIKNHELLIDAFSIVHNTLPNTELLLAGDGETRDNMERKVEDIGIMDSVVFCGNVDDTSNLLMKSDIGVISSKSEAFPFFLLECMDASIPVVATYVGGLRDLIDGNGIYVESDNVDELAKAMMELAIDTEKRELMGEKGRQLIKDFDISIIANKYLSIYKNQIR